MRGDLTAANLWVQLADGNNEDLGLSEIRERLDKVVAGEWDLVLEALPPIPELIGSGTRCSFKARLQILGVIREDVGSGGSYEEAAENAFRRVAVKFGIGVEG